MGEKIFISYNHKDSKIVNTVAKRLELEFGKNNIFYDRWAIQPGDSIIGKMNEGLESFQYFFFMVSENSLKSKMVTLEWQSALNRAINQDLSFVAVKIDDCSVPAILADRLYIDLYGEGLDDAISKMRCCINGEPFDPNLEEVNNLFVHFEVKDNKTIMGTVQALYYSEINPTLAFACEKKFSACFNVSDTYTISRSQIIKVDSLELQAREVDVQRPIKPGFPFTFLIDTDDANKIGFYGLYQLIDAENMEYKLVEQC